MTAGAWLLLGEVWVWIGLAVAAVLVLWGAGAAEENARGAWAFRLLLVPGAVLLWPLVALRLGARLRGEAPGLAAHRPPRRAQDGAALLLALFVPTALGTAMAIRQDGPRHAAAVLLEAPEGSGEASGEAGASE
ncbi:MAG: hypothetical protein AAF763_16080 [Pseudomonadota bacterium]